MQPQNTVTLFGGGRLVAAIIESFVACFEAYSASDMRIWTWM